MEDKICYNCKFWKEGQINSYGQCSKTLEKIKFQKSKYMSDSIRYLLTFYNHGCVLFKEKEY